MEYVAFHYLTHVTTTKSCTFFEDELDVRKSVMKWLEMCSKQDKNVMGSYMMKKGWEFEHFVNYFQTKTVMVNELVLYIISHIVWEPIGVISKDHTWNSTVNAMLSQTQILFAYCGENHFIPISHKTDSELEEEPSESGSCCMCI